jgi:uncharacterized protein YprB with RNaseH-like and TPR domain
MLVIENDYRWDDGTKNLYIEHTPDSVYIDIETTGLSARFNRIYMVGCLYASTEGFSIRQWMTEKPEDEYELLYSLSSWLKGTKLLVHYNGSSFDIPFLRKRMVSYGISFPEVRQLDIMRLLSPYKVAFNFSNMKLKTIEKSLGHDREDKFSGKELIDDYKAYEKKPSESIKEKLLMHNSEDLSGLLLLLPLFNKVSLHKRFTEGELPIGNFTASASSQAVRYNFDIEYMPDSFEGLSNPQVDVNIQKKDEILHVTMTIELYHGELKHFLTPVQDYRYVPARDNAYHKDTVKFLDGEESVKATRDTAYLRVQDTFIKVPFPLSLQAALFQKSLDDSSGYYRLRDLESADDHKLLVKAILTGFSDRRKSTWTQSRNHRL